MLETHMKGPEVLRTVNERDVLLSNTKDPKIHLTLHFMNEVKRTTTC